MRGLAAWLAAVVALMVLVAGCSSPPKPPPRGLGPVGAFGADRVMRLGYVPGVMDAPALIGLQSGGFTAGLRRMTLDPVAFGSDQAETAALQDGQLDAAYLDPVAAVTAWQSARRSPVRIVAGGASGGVQFVVRKGISSAGQLAHAHLAAPAGGAQEAALDYWLHQHGLPALKRSEVAVMPDDALVREFQSGKLMGGWEPAPVDAELAAAGGRVLVDEAGLWPGRRFATSVLVVTRRFLARDPGAVSGLLRGQIQADDFIAARRVSAEAIVRQELTARLGSRMPPAVLSSSFAQLSYTADPDAASVLAEARHAAAAGLVRPVTSLAGLFDLGPLNTLLRAAGRRPVRS
jgi:NitT/TauT family transport system substrate-binding protein